MILKNKYKRLDVADIHYLWCDDYFDGPLSGVGTHCGEKCYFKIITESSYHRKHFLYRLSPEQLKSEEYKHELFKEYVGSHYDYIETALIKGVTRDFNLRKPQSLWEKYYSVADTMEKLDLSKCEIIGYYVR